MRALRDWVVFFTGVAAVAVLCVWLGAAENVTSAAKTPDLTQRVAALEAKVAQLEKRLEEQSTRGYYLTPAPGAPVPYLAPPATPAQPNAPAQQVPPAIPPNAVPHQFNGQTYYIMPLGKEAAR